MQAIFQVEMKNRLPAGNAVGLGGSVGVILLVPGLKSFT